MSGAVAPTSTVRPPAERPGVSVVINTLNEAANIADCIRSVGGFADEVVVCDMSSQDATTSIAAGLGARVEQVSAALCDFGRLRHFAVSRARHEWVLVIDADERLTPALAARLRRAVTSDEADLVRFGNLFWYFGGWVRHGGFFSDSWIRFFKRRAYLERYVEGDEPVHDDLSVLKSVQRQVTLPDGHYLEHLAYPTIEKYVAKTAGLYARVEAEQYHREGRRFSVARLLGDPARAFVSRYVRHRGYREGTRGLILCVLFAMYRFSTWANVWLLEQSTQPAAKPDAVSPGTHPTAVR